MSLSRKELIEKMASKAYSTSFVIEPRSWTTANPTVKDAYRVDAMVMLDVVLAAIENGEVVDINMKWNNSTFSRDPEIVIKPDFQRSQNESRD